MLGVEVERLAWLAASQQLHRSSLPRLLLAAVLRQLDREPAQHEATERAARVDLGQLAMIAHQHELPARALHVLT